MEVPDIPPSSSFRFRTRRRTRWSDEDVQGVVNNAVYLTLFEEARHQYFGDLGLLEGGEFPFVLLQKNLRLLAPGRGGVEVEIELLTVEFTRTSFRQLGRIRDAGTGVVLAEKEAILVTWDPGTRSKAPTAAAFRSAVEAFEAGE